MGRASRLSDAPTAIAPAKLRCAMSVAVGSTGGGLMTKTTADLIEELRELVREANGVRGDLERMLREWRRELDQTVDSKLETCANPKLNELTKHIDKLMREIDQGVTNYFVSLVQALLVQVKNEIDDTRASIVENLKNLSPHEQADAIGYLFANAAADSALGRLRETIKAQPRFNRESVTRKRNDPPQK